MATAHGPAARVLAQAAEDDPLPPVRVFAWFRHTLRTPPSHGRAGTKFNRRAKRRQYEIVRVQDAGLTTADDPTVLEWAAQAGRVLLAHDVATITHDAYERVRAGQPMPGVFEVRRTLPLAQAINDIILIAECSWEGEWED